MAAISEAERLKRWRLVLGKECEGGMGGGGAGRSGGAGSEGDSDGGDLGFSITGREQGMAGVLNAFWAEGRSAGLGGSSLRVARSLSDIRAYFPKAAVRVMHQDALQRLNLTQMLTVPDLLETVEADVHLVANL